MMLDDLLTAASTRVAQRCALVPEERLREELATAPPPRDFARALRGPGVALIAEIKRASPSRGALNLALSPEALAVTYAAAGAAAISVLTEESRFRGSLDDLRAARQGLEGAGFPCPLLRKDFVVDPYQLLEARVWGADAVLLIAAALEDGLLARLFHEAQALGLTPLVEVHTAEELARVLPLRPPVMGINNRDLRDFSISLEVTRRLRPLIPPGILVIAESGIHGAAEMRALAAMGVDAALVGEALVTAADPAAKLRELQEAGR